MNENVRVCAIEWLSKPAEEALVLVTDGEQTCGAFSQPCTMREGDIVREPLLAFDSTNIECVTETAACFEKIDLPFGYRVYGQVLDRSARLVNVGKVLVQIDVPLPGDIDAGDSVKFECVRLDLLA